MSDHSGGRRLLSEAEVIASLAQLPEWTRDGGTIRRSLVFPSFAEGIRFVGRVAAEADALDHHPDIDIRYTTVALALSTHGAGGLTCLDIEMAERIDRLAS